MKRKRTIEEISKAYGKHCPHSCGTCLRSCTASSGYAHRFDCCGVVVAHVMMDPPKGDLYVGVIDNPMARGYLTGPSRTMAPA